VGWERGELELVRSWIVWDLEVASSGVHIRSDCVQPTGLPCPKETDFPWLFLLCSWSSSQNDTEDGPAAGRSFPGTRSSLCEAGAGYNLQAC
jgi:hypothetical protein